MSDKVGNIKLFFPLETKLSKPLILSLLQGVGIPSKEMQTPEGLRDILVSGGILFIHSINNDQHVKPCVRCKVCTRWKSVFSWRLLSGKMRCSLRSQCEIGYSRYLEGGNSKDLYRTESPCSREKGEPGYCI